MRDPVQQAGWDALLDVIHGGAVLTTVAGWRVLGLVLMDTLCQGEPEATIPLEDLARVVEPSDFEEPPSAEAVERVTVILDHLTGRGVIRYQREGDRVVVAIRPVLVATGPIR